MSIQQQVKELKILIGELSAKFGVNFNLEKIKLYDSQTSHIFKIVAKKPDYTYEFLAISVRRNDNVFMMFDDGFELYTRQIKMVQFFVEELVSKQTEALEFFRGN